jgi:hypothetical protein
VADTVPVAEVMIERTVAVALIQHNTAGDRIWDVILRESREQCLALLASPARREVLRVRMLDARRRPTYDSSRAAYLHYVQTLYGAAA